MKSICHLISLFAALIYSFTNCIPTQKSDLSDKVLLPYLYFSQTGPGFFPNPGYYDSPQLIRLEDLIPGTRIHYTTDGTEPTIESALYTEPIPIWRIAGSELKAISVNPQGIVSKISSGIYSYAELKTGQLSSFVNFDDGYYRTGVDRTYIFPSNHPEFINNFVTVDTTTGLIWRSCTNLSFGVDPGCNVTFVGMNWTDANSGPNGCDSLNSANSGRGYYGLKTWRLPSFEELRTLLDFGVNAGAKINESAFPRTSTNIAGYWTGSIIDGTQYRFIRFDNGTDGYAAPADSKSVRCVASPLHVRKFNALDLGNGVIQDRKTGLYWQKCFRGRDNPISCAGIAGMDTNWQNNLDYCESLSLANRKWRVPNINELSSLVQENTTSFNSQVFPNPITEMTASSTTVASLTANIHTRTFDDSTLTSVDKVGGLAFALCTSDP